jgi:tRNA(Ile2) C34 agmatinyltransferase TiaS
MQTLIPPTIPAPTSLCPTCRRRVWEGDGRGGWRCAKCTARRLRDTAKAKTEDAEQTAELNEYLARRVREAQSERAAQRRADRQPGLVARVREMFAGAGADADEAARFSAE